MRRKNTLLEIVPRCARHYYSPDASVPGEAAVAVNLRQREQWLEVTGVPGHYGDIPSGHRLMLVDGADVFTVKDGLVYRNGVKVSNAAREIIAMHRVGDCIVAVSPQGMMYFQESGGVMQEMNMADAVPSLTIVAADQLESRQSLSPYSFAEPYSRWASPLGVADVAAIASRYRTAWNSAKAAVAASGGYYAPLNVCYGVRMWDDNYMWISDAVTVGLDTLSNASMVSAQVAVESTRYTGIEASQFVMRGYRLGIKVNSGVPAQWRKMVKAIDVFATVQPAIAAESSLDYRCVTQQGGTRASILEYGWQALSRDRVMAALETSGWCLVASTTSIDSLGEGRFEAANVAYVPITDTCVVNAPLPGGVTLTLDETAAVKQGSAAVVAAASMVRNGRLYVASRDGMIAVSAHGNAMITSQVARVTGAEIHAVAPVSRPLYSGGFGRYAVYLFTSEGIYAVAQSALGTLGEARLVDRSVISPGCMPVDGDRDVYFTDRNGCLCRLTGSTVSRLIPDMGVAQSMAWDDAHRELHVLTAGGTMLAVQQQGVYSHRTVPAVHLYDDVTHALAVTAAGEVLDLAHEEEAAMSVNYQSHPVVLDSLMRAVPRMVSWHVNGKAVVLSLSLTSERGISCHGFLAGRIRVNGAVHAPLSMPLITSPCRCVRLAVEGSASTGTVIAPFTLAYL